MPQRRHVLFAVAGGGGLAVLAAYGLHQRGVGAAGPPGGGDQAGVLGRAVEPWNAASWRTAGSAGYQREGLLRSHQEIGGHRVDMFLYADQARRLDPGNKTPKDLPRPAAASYLSYETYRS